MPEISVIVFDLGNVLIPFDYKPLIAKFNKIDPGMGDKFARMYKENYNIHRSYEKGELTTDEFLAKMLEWTNHNFDGETFSRYFSDIFSLNQNVIDLLPKLKKNYKLVLLSNTNDIHKKYGYGHQEFLKIFDALFLSHEVGAVKPEIEIYKAVEKFTRAAPPEHLFIDDIAEYVEGAKKAGWQSVQFTGYGKLKMDFDEFGIQY